MTQFIARTTMGLLAATAATAHPTNLEFETRGQCERAQADVNNFDRQYVAEPVFGITNNGEAQVFFLEGFECEFDPVDDVWRMVRHLGDDSDIGRAWDR